MELLAFDDEGISDLATDDHDDDFSAHLVHFVEDSKITEPQLVISQRVGSKRLDGPTWGHRLIAETRSHPVADDPLLPGW
jgi:hypothetical protein